VNDTGKETRWYGLSGDTKFLSDEEIVAREEKKTD